MSFLSNVLKMLNVLARTAHGCEGMRAWRNRRRGLPSPRSPPRPFDRKRFLSTRLKS
jgi:hypothetical protein